MRIGYSFWGYLGDIKFDNKGNIASTPDGNAFYSWAIIDELQRRGADVYRLMPNRDKIGYEKLGANLFGWCKSTRLNCLLALKDIYPANIDWSKVEESDLFRMWDEIGVNNFDFILHEWRMEIKGRNDDKAIQPDYFIQKCLLEYCKIKETKLVIFDLDYKIDEEELNTLSKFNNIYFLELGYKLSNISKSYHVEIPFNFRFINELNGYKYDNSEKNNLVYIGNRYERDWCIDKYIPTELDNILIYGNWNEGGRNSSERWPKIRFMNRLQSAEMPNVYSNSICTILLAKEEYVKYGFMTARLVESAFFGCIPLFIEEYGYELIKKYAGIYAEDLVVSSKSDVINKVCFFKNNPLYGYKIIEYLREHLSFMDIKYFIDKVQAIIGGNNGI